MKSHLAARVVAALLVLMSVGVLRSQAQINVSWLPGTGNWSQAGFWSGGVVPNNGGGKTYNVTISNGITETVTLNLDVTISDLTMGADATLQSAAGDSLTIAGGGTLTNDSGATITFNTTGSNLTIDSGGTLTNNGTLQLEAAGEILSVTGNTTNTGTISLDGGSSATFTGSVTNSGTFQTGLSGGSNTVNVSGTFTNNAGATVILYSTTDSINVNALSNSGTIYIGYGAVSGATLTITGGGQGVTDVVAGSVINLFGNFNVVNSGKTTSALANLNSVEGTLTIENGQTTTITPGSGTLTIASSGALDLSDLAGTTTGLAITGNVSNSGGFTTGFFGGTNTVNVSGTFTNAAGGTVILYSGTDSLNVNALSNSGLLQIGNRAGSGATVTITGGGQGVTDVVAGSTIALYGNLNVVNSGKTTGALANLTTVAGTLDLMNNQSTSVMPGGGTLTIASTGVLELSDAVGSTTTLSITGNVSNSGTFSTGFSGGTNTVTVSGTFTNSSTGLLVLYGNSDVMNIPTLSNSGTVQIGNSGTIPVLNITGTGTLTNSGNINIDGGTLQFTGSTASLTGGGTVTLNPTDAGAGTIKVGSSNTGTLTNVNNTITGQGNLGDGKLTLVNEGTIIANGNLISSAVLTVQPGSAGATNSGIMEATNPSASGATLVLEGTFNNTGGTIEALGESGVTASATVELAAGTVINGGTLTTTTSNGNSGVIENTGTVTLNGITNTGTYTDSAGDTTILEGAIANSGSITLTGSTLSLGNSVTLTGNGTIVLSNSTTNLITASTTGLTLTNASTIEGSGTIQKMGIVNTGTISANQSAALLILPSSAGLNNKGTLSVSSGDTMEIGTSTGGVLLNFSGTTLTGGAYTVSGTLEFGASGTSVVTDAANISLTGASAEIEDFAGQNVMTGLATITSAGSFTIGSGANFTTAGNFTNDGKLTVNSGSTFKVTGSLINFSNSTDTLTKGTYTVGGKLDFAGADIVTDAANLTMSGTGEIVNSTNSSNGLTGLTTITSAGSFTLESKANFTTLGNLTNDGKLTVNSGSTLTVTGDLTNFNSGTDTLSSGTYTVGGTFEFTGANIVNNAANLTISGTSARILNGTTNGLANFANNTGEFSVTGDASFTTASAAFTNSGTVTVANGSTLRVGGSNNAYNQSAGTTTVDGLLSAGGAAGVNVTGGTLLGSGSINASTTVGGSGTAPTINIGDTGKAGLLAITGTYTQLATASMNVFIGGTTVGTEYSQLQVSSSATLAGTLTVKLASGFTPTIGSTFTVVTAAGINGSFSNSTIAINSSEQFDISYTSNGVVLTVVAISAPQSGVSADSNQVAALPRRQPVAISGLRRVAGTGIAVPRSRALRPIGGALLKYEGSNGLTELPRAITPWGSPAARPVALRESRAGRTAANNNWIGTLQGVSGLRRQAIGTFQPAPVKILQPALPRLPR